MTEPREISGRWQHLAAMTAGALIVLTAWAFLQGWGLERTPFHTKGEPREGLVVWEMIHSGEWILPRRNGIELPSKPPFFHWLGALVSLAHGTVDEWSIRLPSALFSGAAALLVFFAGATLWGARAGIIAALSMMTSFEWERAATSARVDMTLTFALTMAFTGLLLFRERRRARWLIVAYTGMAAAVLAKGPVGLALPFLQIIAVSLIDRSTDFLRRLRLLPGLAAVALIAGAWYALAIREGGYAFIAKQILLENVDRILGGKHYAGGHVHSVAYLARALAAGLLPWTLVLPSVVPALWQSRASIGRRDPRVYLLVWITLVFGVYATAVSKRGVYLLALYPAVFLLLGWWWDRALRAETHPRWLARLFPAAAWPLAALLALLAIFVVAEHAGIPTFSAAAGALAGEPAAQARAFAAFAAANAAALATLFAAATAGAVLAALAAHGERWGLAFTGFLLSMAMIVVSIQQLILPEIARQKTRRSFVAAVRRAVPAPAALRAYRDFDYGLAFYWGGRIPVWPPPPNAEPPYLIMAQGDWAALGPVARTVYERIPLIESGPAGNMGRLVLVQRLAAPGTTTNVPWAAATPDDEDDDTDAD